MEFSSLEAKNYVGKFGFTDLALIEKDSKKTSDFPDSKPFVQVTVFESYILLLF